MRGPAGDLGVEQERGAARQGRGHLPASAHPDCVLIVYRYTRTWPHNPCSAQPDCLLIVYQCTGVPIHTRRFHLPGLATAQPDCLLIVYRCTCTHSPLPSPWPGHCHWFMFQFKRQPAHHSCGGVPETTQVVPTKYLADAQSRGSTRSGVVVCRGPRPPQPRRPGCRPWRAWPRARASAPPGAGRGRHMMEGGNSIYIKHET